MEGWGEKGTQSTLWGFRAVTDMAVVITQRLLLPMLPHLRPAKCPHGAGRRPTTSEECQVRHGAGLVHPEMQTLPKKNVLIRLLTNLLGG